MSVDEIVVQYKHWTIIWGDDGVVVAMDTLVYYISIWASILSASASQGVQDKLPPTHTQQEQ